MERKNTFFLGLFAVGFLLSAFVMSEDYLGKMVERHDDNSYQFVEESSVIVESDIIVETETEYQETNPEEIAEEKPLEFETVDLDYFEDALFIGDSRTVGIMEYGNLEQATFFADSGMSVYGLESKKIDVPNIGKVTFEEILTGRQYGKIYLMLGLNELGYQFENTRKKYQETVEKIRMYQETAVLYLCANMHVTAEQSAKEEIYNNANVNRMNEMIQSLSDNKTIFYIDVNELFDDESGSLSTEYSSDAFHVLGKYYMDWVNWLCTKAIVIGEN